MCEMSRRAWLCLAVAAGSVGIGVAGAQTERVALPPPTTGPTTTLAPPRLIAAVAIDAPTTTTTATTLPKPKPVAKPKPAGDGLHDENKKDTRPVPKPAGVPLGTVFVGKESGPDIEGFAHYEGQSTCDPTPKAGTLALRDLLLARYPSTKSLGVSRDCAVGGQSEHKEGRAFDWGADIGNGSDVAAVNDFLDALFATDAAGKRFALARRMGIMYVIWNRQIWGAYSADEGWRPYDGANPHTDHVHISLSWAGGRGETSYWDGTVVPGLPDIFAPKPPRPRRTTTTTSTTWRKPRWPTSTTSTTTPATTSSTLTTTSTTATPQDARSCEEQRRRRDYDPTPAPCLPPPG